MDNFSLVPVDYQPDFENVSLVPVDYDPFAGEGATPQAQAQPAQAQTQPVPQAQQAQTQQPTMGASPSSAPTPGTGPTNALTAGAGDFFKSVPRGIVSGFNNAASALGRATQAEMGQDVDAPTPEQGMEILENEVTGPMHRPEGRAGKFGATVGEFLGNPTSYLVPGSLPFKIGTAVLGGLGSEAGGQLGEGTPFDAPFRFAGGSIGALGAAGLGTGARGASTALRAESLGAGRAPAVTANNAAPAAVEEAGTALRSAAPQDVARSGSSELSASAPTGKFYSVLFEHKLRPTSYPGVLRPVHNQEANEALLQAMAGDDAYAQSMQDLGIKLLRTRTGKAPRRPPPGFTWHHAEEPGVLQLVPRYQHDPGSIFQAILHPNGKGGFFIWGK